VGRHPDRHAVRTGHDLLHLPDHRQEAISKVEGVSKIDVTFETREAVVTFDDAKTSVQKLTKATETRAIRPASSSDPLNRTWGDHGTDHASPTRLARSAALFPRWAAPPVSRHRQLGRGHRPGLSTNTKGCSSPSCCRCSPVVALLANALGWLSHRQWHRSLLGMIGPAIVLAAMLLFLAIGGRTSSMSAWP
jgi:copper chaperone CopZ